MVIPKTTDSLVQMKASGDPAAMVVAYDYAMARAASEAGIDAILAGDSGGMVALGYGSTVPVSMDQVVTFCAAVRRGATHTFVIGDMPFGSYEVSDERALENAILLMKEGGADAIKLEGGARVADRIAAIASANIPVMAHLGLTPQTAPGTTGYRPYGRTPQQIISLHQDLLAVEHAGAFSVLLEGIPGELTEIARHWVDIPVYGIGAGVHTDGQLLLSYDLLGLFPDFQPKFARDFLVELKPSVRQKRLFDLMVDAYRSFCEAVKARTFPSESETYSLPHPKEDLLKLAAHISGLQS